MNKLNLPWWKTAIGYQIYPRSFYDSNDDGIGDLNGITQKLPYLQSLGITLIWICPFFASPMDDYGYDVKDYYQVDPSYGTMEDMQNLVRVAHDLGIKVIIDLVLNHTSDEHKWFIEARKNRYSKYHQYYIWKEGKQSPNGSILPPTNWRGYFGDSAWQYDEAAKLYYLKIFSKKMPDLNWEYPPMREDMYRVARYWLDLGIDGFRLDAIAHLAKEKPPIDSSYQVDDDGLVLDSTKFSSLPRLFDHLHEFKQEVLQHYPDALTVGEVGGNVSPAQSLAYSGTEQGPLNMVFNFDTCWENGAYGSEQKSDLEIRTNVIQLKQNFMKWYEGTSGKAWPPIYWLNHDHPRVVSQYGSIRYRKESSTMLATTLLFLYGTPFLYNGEEIGMSNVDYTKLTQFKDVSALNYARSASERLDEQTILRFLRRTSRVNARTPFQWSDAPHAGFSTKEPLFAVNGNYKEVNLASQLKDPSSIVNFYKKAIALRKQPEILQSVLFGSLSLVDPLNPDVFSYVHKGEITLLVISNFRDYSVEFPMTFLMKEIKLHNYPVIEKQGLSLILRPFESYVMVVELL
jgi:glycosidase